MFSRHRLLLSAVLLIAFTALPSQGAHVQAQASDVRSVAVRTTAVPFGRVPPTRAMAATDRETLQSRYLARRERQAAAGGGVGAATAAPGAQRPAVPASRPAEHREAAGDLVEVRNNRNTIALTASSATAEPAAASKGLDVFYTGNWYASYSTNGGANWSPVAIPAGPAHAPYLCCDIDVMYDPGRDVFFWSALYVNDAVTSGVVRIVVQPSVSGPYSCFFDIDPGGATLGVLPDYPHLGLSNNHLYLSTNNDAEWQVWRYATADLTACGTAAGQVISVSHSIYGHRVVVPVRGATTQMYWGLLDDSSTFRIFTWPESSATASSVTRAISASRFVNPACNGGAGNHDFIERETSWMINGFRLRGAVGAGRLTFMWNSAPVAGIPWAHIRAAAFGESTLNLLAEPHLYLIDRCTGYPQLSTSAAGHLGVTGAMGGGESGTAAQGFVTVDDDLTSGTTYAPLITVATATNNQASGRYGDYTTIQPHSPCANLWTATAYGLDGGEEASNVNARYVLFGRERDNCELLPTTPGNFRTTGMTSTTAALAWDDVSGETTYRIGRMLSGGVTHFFSVGAGVTSTTDSNLNPGGQYYYWIQACAAAGCSAWSPSISVRTPPALPANFRLTGTSATAIGMAWDNVSGETAFQVAWVVSSAPSSFTYQSAGQDVLNWSHTGVTPGTTYYYWLRACAGASCSGWSSALIATAAVTPGVPAGLRMTAASPERIDVAWNDVNGELAYQIAWTVSGPILYRFQSIAADTLVWSHTPVTGGATYFYHVRACAGSNCSGWSGGIAATAASVPMIPGNFRITGSTAGTLSVAWDDVPGETTYQIAYTRSSPISYQSISLAANTTATSVSGLTAGTTYYLHIRACTGATCSRYHPGILGATAGARPDAGTRTLLPPQLLPSSLGESEAERIPPPPTDAPAPDRSPRHAAPAAPPTTAPPPAERERGAAPPPAPPVAEPFRRR